MVESELPEPQRRHGFAVKRIPHGDHLGERTGEIDARLSAASLSEEGHVRAAGGDGAKAREIACAAGDRSGEVGNLDWRRAGRRDIAQLTHVHALLSGAAAEE